MITKLETAFSSTVLLGLVLAGVWLFGRDPNRPEKKMVGQSPSYSICTAEPKLAMDLPSKQVQNETPEPRLAIEQVKPPVIHEITHTSPDDMEDMDEIREWARQNPEDALKWALSAPAGPKHDAVSEIVCAQLAYADPAQAVALAERFGAGCSNILINIVQRWAAQDLSAACAFAASKPAGEQRDRLIGRIAFTLSQKDCVAAAQLVAEGISPGKIQDEAAISVLHQWSLRNASAAAAWVQLFPDNLRYRALNEVENTMLAKAGPKP
jgi:hypothetical protein